LHEKLKKKSPVKEINFEKFDILKNEKYMIIQWIGDFLFYSHFYQIFLPPYRKSSICRIIISFVLKKTFFSQLISLTDNFLGFLNFFYKSVHQIH